MGFGIMYLYIRKRLESLDSIFEYLRTKVNENMKKKSEEAIWKKINIRGKIELEYNPNLSSKYGGKNDIEMLI